MTPRTSRAGKLGLIAAFGVLTLAIHVLHLFEEEPANAILAGIVPPVFISFALIGGAWWLYQSSLGDRYVNRALAWTLTGTVVLAGLGGALLVYQAAHGSRLYDPEFVVMNWAATGALLGLLVGYYDGRRVEVEATLRKERDRLSHREASLEREIDRLDRFASIVSHDLRNPLNLATGHLQLAQEGDDPETHLATVEKAHQRMQEIIEEMLELAREGEEVTADEMEQVSLSTVAAESWGTVDTMEASLDVDGDLTFSADASRLRHVFENLFRNAIEHGGERVAVRVGPLDDPTGFYVEDDGPGIDDDIDPFEPGTTTAAEGTGLGLSIVKSIAQAHGWEVRATSAKSGGARFEFTGVSGRSLD